MRLLLIAPAIAFASPGTAQELEIHHIRVGQGDSTLILGPADPLGDRTSVLMDAGDHRFRSDGGATVLEVLATHNVTSLDFFIASHHDADHIGGVVTGPSHRTSFVYGPNGVPGDAGDDDGDGTADWMPDENGDPKPFFAPDPEEVGLGDDVPVGQTRDV